MRHSLRMTTSNRTLVGTGRRWLPGLTAVLTVVAVAGGVALFVASAPQHGSGQYLAMGLQVPMAAGQQASAAPKAVEWPSSAGGSPAAAPSAEGTSHATTTDVPLPPRVVAVSPRPGAANASLTQPLVVLLSSPPRHGAPMPGISPAVPGSWSLTGTRLVFTPKPAWEPWATERVSIPAALASPGALSATAKHGKGSVQARSEEPLSPVHVVGGPPPTRVAHPSPTTYSFSVQGVSLLRAQQVLAELKYLPLRFGVTPLSTSLPDEPKAAQLVSPLPQKGTFTWRYPDIPSSLSALWSAGRANVVTEGAVMRFEDQQGLAVDGAVGPNVWKALTSAVAARRLDPSPYDYLMVQESIPENLVVWRNGQDVFSSPVNTGVTGAVTPDGTWPVYEHLVSTTMVGTDPDGYHYDVPNVPWVAYFYGGDAVHGYWRSSYGWPQSNGCVELPVANAQVVWPMDPIGTLVTVSG